MLLGEGLAKHWMKLAQWEHPEGDLDHLTPHFWQGAPTLIGKCSRAITVAFPKPADRSKVQVCKRSLMNLFMTITVESKIGCFFKI